ncbi:putative related to RNA helicase HEL117 [Rosellinia necatrix]|uniref:Putative related to RNA helicase HEL117 n=1 Tax=Rosellinia necatrix TaxID=77044 RepID=A0A1W2TV41_ROSNE|nr:putative related to RNA helicase HEL117 [Rosellinia necatrix]
MDGSSPQSGRKRWHDDDGADERRVKRRNDDYRDGGRLRRRRSRSPRRPEHTDHRRRHHHHHRHRSRQDPPMELPCGARPLSRSADLDAFRLLFARYLDIQKQIDMAALDEREIRGRWKSFVGKWNNGELAEGWYQPETFEGVMLDSLAAGDETEGESIRSLEGGQDIANGRRRDSPAGRGRDTLPPRRAAARGDEGDATSRSRDTDEDDDEDDDDYGPILPAQNGPRHSNPKTASEAKHGPSIPTIPDLALRREMEASERDEARVLLRQERRDERAQQKERLEELAPRAEAGSQARRLEKRRERREANATFANGRSANEIPDMADSELMGGGAGGGIEEYKRARKEAERKKTEREVRREEMLRAKREEREERAREYREREAQTVDMLREIAKARFG